MIGQNDALDEAKKLGYEKKFDRLKIAFLVLKWPYWPEKIKFWPKMVIFIIQKKIENLFSFFMFGIVSNYFQYEKNQIFGWHIAFFLNLSFTAKSGHFG